MMRSIKYLLLAFVFGEKRANVINQYIPAVKRLTRLTFGRRIVGLEIHPEKTEVKEGWVLFNASATKLYDDVDVSFDLEMIFYFQENRLVMNIVFRDTGEIRQKQLEFERIPL